MFKNLKRNGAFILISFLSLTSCATSSVKGDGDMAKHTSSYMKAFDDFRSKVCEKNTEKTFEEYLRNYRGQGYWIPELSGDVDVDSIKSLLPEMEKKLTWIRAQKAKVKKKKFPSEDVTANIRGILAKLLELKKSELASDEKLKTQKRKESLKLITQLQKAFDALTKKVSFLTNYQHPIDHLKNRKVHDKFRDKEDETSVKIANYTFLYRKLLEDGAYQKDHTGSDIYLRTTLDTLYFELKQHDFYLSEDARFDLDFVLSKIESEIRKGKERIEERLEEWEQRSERTLSFYKSLTLPENRVEVVVNKKKTTPNKELIKEHNRAADRLKEFVYKKQAEVYSYWLKQSEINKSVFVLETILLNEVGGVDGDDALERQDVARVVLNRLDKPKYLSIGKKEFIHPYLLEVTNEATIKNEKWLNALFKQGEFSFTYYYMNGVAKIFCPDMAYGARKLRDQNVAIALQVLKEGDTSFKTTRYFSRASMIGRIHMDSVWEDHIAYPERPGLLAPGQDKLRSAFEKGDYSYHYSFKDPAFETYEVVEIDGKNYAIGMKKGLRIFYSQRNPHYFRYFTKTENSSI